MSDVSVRIVPPPRLIEKLEQDAFDSDAMARSWSRRLSVAGALLTAPGAVIRDLQQRRHLGAYAVALALATAFFTAVYGALLGMYAPGRQTLFAAAKIPIVILGTALLCTPTFYVFNSILGSRLTFRQSATAVLLLAASASLVLVAFAPIAWFFTVSAGTAGFLKFLHVLFFLIAALYGMWTLNTARRYLNWIDATQTSINGAFLALWFVIVLFVGFQMAYYFRPILADGDFFTGERGLFFLDLGGTLREAR